MTGVKGTAAYAVAGVRLLSRTAYIWNVADLIYVEAETFGVSILVDSEASALDICHGMGVSGEPEHDYGDDDNWIGYTRRGVVEGVQLRVTSIWRK